MKFTITAVIPTGQYANIQPSIEVEAETFEEAKAMALPHIEELSAAYAVEGTAIKARDTEGGSKVDLIVMESQFGGKALFDPVAHVYTTMDGKKRLKNASSFVEEKVGHPFPKDMILPMMEKKHGIPKEDIAEMWQLKGDSSRHFGTALHAALEMYGKFEAEGLTLGKEGANNALHTQPIIKKAVEEFFEMRRVPEEGLGSMYEVFVLDEEEGLCGQIDKLLIVDIEKKICRVQDYKTNADLNKIKNASKKKLRAPFDDLENTPINEYWLQLSFYARILKSKGWTVEGLDIFNLTDKWETYSHEVIEIPKEVI